MVFCNFSAHASSTGAVGSPVVKDNETSVEFRTGFTEGEDSGSQDERFRLRGQIDHGLTRYYALRLIGQLDKRQNDNLEFESVTLENRIQFLKKENAGFDFGMRLGYEFKDGDKKPDSLSYGLFEMIPLDDFTIRFNQLFSNDVGSGAEGGIEFESRAQIVYDFADNLDIGAEIYNDFGKLNESSDFDEQTHTFGPVAKFKVNDTLSLETKYRAGLSKAAPDHTIGFFAKHNF